MLEIMNNRSLYFGDNLEILIDKFPGHEGYFDLIYLDPPFNSNRNYNVLFKEGLVDSEAQTHAFEDSWHWTHEAQNEFDWLIANGDSAVSDLMQALRRVVGEKGNDMLAYLTMMTRRLIELHRVLKSTGSIYLHCDPTASHYLKIVMDTIFGKKNFRNEIVWRYQTGGIPRDQWSKKHDTILFYTKSNKWKFDASNVLEPRGEEVLRRLKKGTPGATRATNTMRHPSDVWLINALNAMDLERLGYPTQKPEELLEKIILASSGEDDWILDPFCGCGTTVSVAERLKRNWVGIDISMLAVKLIERRVVKAHPSLKNEIRINGLPKDMAGAHALFQNDPWDFEYWVSVHLLDAKPPAGKSKENMKGADKGIDGVITLIIDTTKGAAEYGKVIVQVKGGKAQRSHVATLKADVHSQRALGGVFVTLEKPTGPMRQEAAQAGNVKTQLGEFPIIQILTVEELLAGKRPNLPGMVSPYKQALAFNPTIPQTSLDI